MGESSHSDLFLISSSCFLLLSSGEVNLDDDADKAAREKDEQKKREGKQPHCRVLVVDSVARPFSVPSAGEEGGGGGSREDNLFLFPPVSLCPVQRT